MEELKFLYETEEEIKGFGYSKDPRVIEIIVDRDMKQDLAIATGLNSEQIVPRDINIFNRQQLANFKNKKYVHGALHIEIHNDIKENIKLSEDLQVKYLYIKTEKIRTLPKRLKAEIVVVNSSTQIQELPSGLNLKELHIRNTKISKLPEDLKVSYLNADNTLITTIPQQTSYNTISANNSQLKTIPENIERIEELFIESTPITKLPEGLKVKRINANHSQLEELPESLEAESINVADTNLQRLPEDLELYELSISETQIKALPKTIKLERLYAEGSQLEFLPDNLEAEEIDIRNTNVTKLPKGLKLEHLFLDGCAITELPEDLQVKDLWLGREQHQKFKDILPKGVKNIQIYPLSK